MNVLQMSIMVHKGLQIQMSLRGEISHDLKEAVPYSFWVVVPYTHDSGLEDRNQQNHLQTACPEKGNA